VANTDKRIKEPTLSNYDSSILNFIALTTLQTTSKLGHTYYVVLAKRKTKQCNHNPAKQGFCDAL